MEELKENLIKYLNENIGNIEIHKAEVELLEIIMRYEQKA